MEYIDDAVNGSLVLQTDCSLKRSELNAMLLKT